MESPVTSARQGAKIPFVIQVIVAFVIINLVLSIFDMIPYLNQVSAFVRSPFAFVKSKVAPATTG